MTVISDLDLARTLRRISEILDELGICYHLTGGIVSTYYGDPRFTQDIDIVLVLDRAQGYRLLAEVKDSHYFSENFVLEAVDRQGMFQLLDNETLIKTEILTGWLKN